MTTVCELNKAMCCVLEVLSVGGVLIANLTGKVEWFDLDISPQENLGGPMPDIRALTAEDVYVMETWECLAMVSEYRNEDQDPTERYYKITGPRLHENARKAIAAYYAIIETAS